MGRRVMWMAAGVLALTASASSTVDGIQEDVDLAEGFHADVDGISVSAGGHHICALEYRPGVEFGGPVRCWGYDHHGQASPPDGHFLQVSCGTYFTCGVAINESVSCWGMDMTPPNGRFLQISVGAWHACGIRQDGTAACWGRNDHKQSQTPSGEFLQIAAGEDVTCGLRRAGNIDCWGEEAARVQHALARNDSTFKQVAAGSSQRVCGLTVEGALVCCGLGERTRHGRKEERWLAEGPFTQISTSPHNTCGLKVDGDLWCLGDDYTRYLITPQARDMRWTEVSVGGDMFCAISEEHAAVHCFGRHMRLFGDHGVTSPEDFVVA